MGNQELIELPSKLSPRRGGLSPPVMSLRVPHGTRDEANSARGSMDLFEGL